jgi:hypothetical protein
LTRKVEENLKNSTSLNMRIPGTSNKNTTADFDDFFSPTSAMSTNPALSGARLKKKENALPTPTSHTNNSFVNRNNNNTTTSMNDDLEFFLGSPSKKENVVSETTQQKPVSIRKLNNYDTNNSNKNKSLDQLGGLLDLPPSKEDLEKASKKKQNKKPKLDPLDTTSEEEEESETDDFTLPSVISQSLAQIRQQNQQKTQYHQDPVPTTTNSYNNQYHHDDNLLFYSPSNNDQQKQHQLRHPFDSLSPTHNTMKNHINVSPTSSSTQPSSPQQQQQQRASSVLLHGRGNQTFGRQVSSSSSSPTATRQQLETGPVFEQSQLAKNAFLPKVERDGEWKMVANPWEMI